MACCPFFRFLHFCFLWIGNMTQANSIASGLHTSFGIPPMATGVVLMFLIAMVIIGGIKRIAAVTEKFVPFMALFYICGGLIVILANAGRIPAAFEQIFAEAFKFRAVGGGVFRLRYSYSNENRHIRGVFSNEAGLGSSVMVHSASDVKEPVQPGDVGEFLRCLRTPSWYVQLLPDHPYFRCL